MIDKKEKKEPILIYFTTRESVHDLLKRVAKKYEPYEIYYNRFGKPCVRGDKFYFSISHTETASVLVVSDEPIGIDIEDLNKKRKYDNILLRMSLVESFDIKTHEDFIHNWTAREAFAKYVGTSVYVIFKEIEYYNGNMTSYFRPTGAYINHFRTNYGIIAVCQEDKDANFDFIDMIKNPDTEV